MATLVCAVAFAAGASLSSAEAPKESEPIVGRWRWIDRQVVDFRADGSIAVSPTNRKGSWKLLPTTAAERKYEVVWDEGLFVDSLTMARDLKKLSGKNQDGKKITGTKID